MDCLYLQTTHTHFIATFWCDLQSSVHPLLLFVCLNISSASLWVCIENCHFCISLKKKIVWTHLAVSTATQTPLTQNPRSSASPLLPNPVKGCVLCNLKPLSLSISVLVRLHCIQHYCIHCPQYESGNIQLNKINWFKP